MKENDICPRCEECRLMIDSNNPDKWLVCDECGYTCQYSADPVGLLSSQLSIAIEALQNIQNGTVDILPPFRALGHHQMKNIAHNALEEITSLGKEK